MRNRLMVGVLIILATALVLVVPALADGPFPDVPSSHPYSTAIADLASRSVIGGFTDGTFGPEKPVTRQQFAKMIVLTMGFPVTESDLCAFSDVLPVSSVDPFYPDNYIAVAARAGLTQGYPDNTFRPGSRITLQQIVSMVVRAAGTNLHTPPANWAGTLNCSDPTHGANIRKAEFNDLTVGLEGINPSWNGSTSANRGECAQLLDNLRLRMSRISTTTTTARTTTSTTVAEQVNLRVLDHGFRTIYSPGMREVFIAAVFRIQNAGNVPARFESARVYALGAAGNRLMALDGGTGGLRDRLAPGQIGYVSVMYWVPLLPGEVQDVELVLTGMRDTLSPIHWLELSNMYVTRDFLGRFVVRGTLTNTSTNTVEKTLGGIVLGASGTPIAQLSVRSQRILAPGESTEFETDYAPGEYGIYEGLSVMEGLAWDATGY